MENLITVVTNYIQAHQAGIWALIGGSAGLSAAIQWFLHKSKINGPVASFWISHIFAALTAVSAFILDAVHPNAGVTYAWLWFVAQFWHRLVVNPAYNKVVLPFLDWLANQKPAAAPVTQTAETLEPVLE